MENQDNELPLYQQVKAAVLSKIKENNLQPGDLLPTEAEMEAMYRVSRTTIRAAISELQAEGYLVRQQGRGTFVANNSYADCQAVLQSFTQDVEKRGDDMRTVQISVDMIIPNAELQRDMNLGENPMLRIQRLRYINEVPTILTTSYLPEHVYERLDWKNVNFSDCSLYERLENNGVDFESGEEIVEVCTASMFEAALLGIPVGSVLSKNQRKVFDSQGRLVEYSHNLTRGDGYRLYIRLKKSL